MLPVNKNCHKEQLIEFQQMNIKNYVNYKQRRLQANLLDWFLICYNLGYKT